MGFLKNIFTQKTKRPEKVKGKIGKEILELCSSGNGEEIFKRLIEE